MVKYKGRAKGKVHMPKKPAISMVLLLFLLWLSFIVRVISDFTRPSEGLNYVVYCNNYYSSGPLIEMLASKKICSWHHQEDSSRISFSEKISN